MFFYNMSQNHSIDFKMAGVSILSAGLLLFGFLMTMKYRVSSLPEWAVRSPYILVTSSKPNEGLSIYAAIDENGSVEMHIFRSDKANAQTMAEVERTAIEAEDNNTVKYDDSVSHESSANDNPSTPTETWPDGPYDIWILICAGGIKDGISWETDSRSQIIENYKITSETFRKGCTVIPTNYTSGCDYVTLFKLSFGTGNLDVADIKFDIGKKYALYRENGIARPVLPAIIPWLCDKGTDETRQHYLEFDNDEILQVIDETLTPAINGQNMHLPVMDVSMDYTSMSVIYDSELVLEEAVPEISDGQPLVNWTVARGILPVLQYTDRRWERMSAVYNIIGGAMLGLGISLIGVLISSVIRRRGE